MVVAFVIISFVLTVVTVEVKCLFDNKKTEPTETSESDFEKAIQYSKEQAEKERILHQQAEIEREKLKAEVRREIELENLKAQARREIEQEMTSLSSLKNKTNSFEERLWLANPADRCAVMKEKLTRLPKEKTNVKYANNDDQSLEQFLRDVVYRRKMVSFQGECYTISGEQKSQSVLLNLLKEGETVLSAKVDMPTKQLLSIDFNGLHEKKRYLARYFFETFISEQLETFLSELSQKNNAAHFPKNNNHTDAPPSDNEHREQERLMNEVLMIHRHISTLTDSILGHNLDNHFELRHQLEHHYGKPVDDIVTVYQSMSFEIKKEVHSELTDTLQACAEYLHGINQSFEQEKAVDLKERLQLLNLRLIQQ